MSSGTDAIANGRGVAAAWPRAQWRSRGWAITGALSVTETVSYGILYYAFAAFLVPMQQGLGYSTAQLTGAFSAAILVSAVAGIPLGRYLDRHGPRGLMTTGSVAATLLVLAWSRVEGLAAFYVVWVGIGLAMAAVLYEAAFTVLAKHFAEPAERRRAMTAMTLVAALASFIFVPLSQVLIDAYGWRDALVILAVILGVTTVPLHALVLRGPPPVRRPADAGGGSTEAAVALRSGDFWMLSAAFFLAQLAAIAMVVHAIPFLLERGHSAAFAALAVGLIGIAQIPGRVLFAPLAARLAPAQSTSAAFVLAVAGIATVVSVPAPWAVLTGFVLLGMGNGMATLARATVIADRYGQAAYGTIAGVAASIPIAARALAPVAAALYATAVGYAALLWTLATLALAAAALAYRAELSRRAKTGMTPPPPFRPEARPPTRSRQTYQRDARQEIPERRLGLSGRVLDVTERADERQLRDLLSPSIGFPTPQKVAAVAHRYRNDEDWTLYGWEDESGALIGCIGLERRSRREVRVRHLAVVPGAERQRVGSALIAAAIESTSVERLLAETDEDAVGFYERCGFRIAETTSRWDRQRFLCTLNLSPPQL